MNVRPRTQDQVFLDKFYLLVCTAQIDKFFLVQKLVYDQLWTRLLVKETFVTVGLVHKTCQRKLGRLCGALVSWGLFCSCSKIWKVISNSRIRRYDIKTRKYMYLRSILIVVSVSAWLANWVNKNVNPQTDTQHHSNIFAQAQIQKRRQRLRERRLR